MRTTVKVFLVFDNIYLCEDQAIAALEGWENKERISTCYVSVGERNLDEMKEMELNDQIEYMASLAPCVYDTYEQAREETREMNYEYHY